MIALALAFPPRGGIDLRSWQNVTALRAGGPVGMFGLRSDPPSAPPGDGIEVWTTSREPGLTDPDAGSALDWMRDPVALPWDAYYSPVAAREIDGVVRAFDPEVIVIEHLPLYRYIPGLGTTGARLVLDCPQLESAYNRELAASGQLSPPAALVWRTMGERIADVERQVFASVDEIWVCSEREAEMVRSTCRSAAPVTVVPNTVDVDSYTSDSVAEARHVLLFPAMFAYPPNQSAALFLSREVFPRLVTRFPDVRVVLVGRNVTGAIAEAAGNDPRIVVTGAVPDVRPYLRAAGVMPVPLFTGGGTRLKVLEAFAAGVPVVSTAKGVEGLDVVADVHYLRAEDPEGFVTAITRLWSEPELVATLTERALACVRERYSYDVARSAIAASMARAST